MAWSSVDAQHADTTLTDFEGIGAFDEAVSVAASPSGILYVVDQGASSIHQFDANGRFVRELGGPGISEGQFDAPRDIDPTNGLVLVVADAGNGRIQRFSREFLFLESLRLSDYSGRRVSSFPDQPRYRQNESTGSFGSGRPIAVATSSNNEMYAIDAARQVVVRWDQDRNITQVIGDYDAGEGALMEPVALELTSEGGILVLDRGHDAILAYDAFGGYLYSMGGGSMSDAVALERMGTMLLIALPDALHLYHERGLLESMIQIEIDEPIVDVLYYKGRLYVLSARRLYMYRGLVDTMLKPVN